MVKTISLQESSAGAYPADRMRQSSGFHGSPKFFMNDFLIDDMIEIDRLGSNMRK